MRWQTRLSGMVGSCHHDGGALIGTGISLQLLGFLFTLRLSGMAGSCHHDSVVLIGTANLFVVTDTLGLKEELAT